MSRFFIFCFLILASLAATAQPVLDKLVNFSVTNQSLEETLYQFSETAEVKLTFSNDILPNKKLTYSFSNATIQQILNSILKDTELVLSRLPTLSTDDYPGRKSNDQNYDAPFSDHRRDHRGSR